MRVIFLGTPEFAVKPFEALLSLGGVEVIAAVTNPDKPVGRKRVLTAPPVKLAAKKAGVPVYQYKSIRKEGVEDLIELSPDLMVTCAFGQILSEEVLNVPKYGVLNIHGSLLPKYRGASPIQNAVLNGESVTGITIMKTDVGVDTGDVMLQRQLTIGKNETSGELFERLSVLGAECIVQAIKLLLEGKAVFIPQDEKLATRTGIIRKEDAFIDFTSGAETTVNKIRAYNPSPAAYTVLNGETLKIHRAEIAEGSGSAGEVIRSSGELVVACAIGAVSLKTVQKAGGKAMDIADFLRGNKVEKGSFLGK